MNNLEIGSEFWNEGIFLNIKKEAVVFNSRNKGFLCGRTALDYIIRDAKADMGLKSVVLPSYCCHTMIEPFLRNNISVRFYSVFPEEGKLKRVFPEPKEDEALYLMPYFGFENLEVYDKKRIKQWKFCILDETHSCFIKDKIRYDDWNIRYTFTSYRKWANIRGFASARKKNDDFLVYYNENINHQYSDLIKDACLKKQRYIEKRQGEKEDFLKMYHEAEEMLEEDYADYGALVYGIAAYEMLDVEQMRERRRKNAEYLLEQLKEVKEIDILFSVIKEKDCPLFVPILLKEKQRNNLRNYLISQKIYCPIHWGISEYHNLNRQEEQIYRQELSLVCDQRYGLSEMKRIVKHVIDFFERQVNGS